MTKSTCAALAVLLAALACLEPNAPGAGGEGAACAPNGPFMGAFDGAAAGAVAGQMAGCAYYVIENGPPIGSTERPSKVWALVVSNGRLGRFDQTIGLLRITPLLPGQHFRGLEPGTYPVGDPLALGIHGAVVDRATGIRFDFTSGSIEITETTHNGSRGTLNLTATEVGGTATVTVTGAFRARCYDPYWEHNDEQKPDESRIGPCDQLFVALRAGQ